MVTITNGVKTFRVTAGSVKPYKSMGFHVVTDRQLEEKVQNEYEHYNDSGMLESQGDDLEHGENEEEPEESKEYASSADDAFVEELLEKSLSQWSNDEIKEFVRIKGIDTSGAQKVSQVRGIIKSYLDEEQKNKDV